MSLIRPNVDRIAGYAPGEQPQETGWTKLNTNENPYPPSSQVVAAIEAAARGRLNIYPDPLAKSFCRRAAELFGVDPEWVLPANGSDENLTILVRTFADSTDLITYPYPSYILYETLADLQGAQHERLHLNADWSWNHDEIAPLVAKSKLVIVPNPNSPSGNRWTEDDLRRLIPPRGILVVDEAYADFADGPSFVNMLKGPDGERVIVTRTLSKSYSLAGIRFGFAIAHPALIDGMRKMKDSYNCNTLSLAAAHAALADQAAMRANVEKIRATRARLIDALRGLGLGVVDSQANFLWATRTQKDHQRIYEALKARKILIRYMKFPNTGPARGTLLDGLRITIGTDAEVDHFLTVLREVL